MSVSGPLTRPAMKHATAILSAALALLLPATVSAQATQSKTMIDVKMSDGAFKEIELANTNNYFIGFDGSGNLVVKAGNSGSVTSVGASVPTGLQVSGSPVTGSGTLAITYQAGYVGYTTTEQTKLAGIATGATANTGTVTSVGGAGTVNGLTLTGTVTGSGNLTLGGTLSGINLTSAVTGILPAANGGTANGFTAFSGPTTSTKTFTLPNASATVLTDNAAVTVAQGGTGRTTSTTAYGLIAAGTTATGSHQTLPAGATTEILVGGGASALPVWTTATGSGAPVRGTSPSLTSPAISGGTINNASVGATTPSTGAFTSLSATGLVSTAASASGGAGLRIPHGSAPSAPTNGDVWTTTSGVFVRVNGGTMQLGSGSGTVSSVALSAPTGLTVSGSPVTTSGTLTLSYTAGYQGYTTTEASKLSGIQAGAQVVNKINIATAGGVIGSTEFIELERVGNYLIIMVDGQPYHIRILHGEPPEP